ncbi:MAG: GbsR/MarR family transcriptional regulator [Sulfobacillus sp.]
MESPASNLIERFGVDFEQSGSTRSLGRVFAALLVAEEPQTLNDLASTLQVSKATISLTLKQALQAQLVDKVTKPGDRRDYWEVPDDVWIRTTLSQLHLLTRWKLLAFSGMRQLPDSALHARQRLNKMIAFFEMVEARFADWEAEWSQNRD